MFCIFKSVPKEEIDGEINKIIKDFNLEDKKDKKACNLSGGQKRKLSICIALVGGISVIFLDEPTSGMDVTSKRDLWDILKRYANGRIIILITHSMQEASVLGNRIGILSEGVMKCMGSTSFLIERFGKIINLNITKNLNARNDEIINFVKNSINYPNIGYEIYNEEILFRIPQNNKEFNGKLFFKKLDENLDVLNIKDYSISMSTLEDVFINLSKLIKYKTRFENSPLGNEINEEEIERKNRENNYLILYDDNNYNQVYNRFTRIIRDTKISMKKRLIQIWRDKKTFVLEIICPILLALIGCFVCNLEILEKNQIINFDIDQITTGSQTIYYYNSFAKNEEVMKIFEQYSQNKDLDIVYNNIDIKYDSS